MIDFGILGFGFYELLALFVFIFGASLGVPGGAVYMILLLARQKNS